MCVRSAASDPTYLSAHLPSSSRPFGLGLFSHPFTWDYPLLNPSIQVCEITRQLPSKIGPAGAEIMNEYLLQ